ncbi:hypothetical protein [Millisia brevis]|uniref:hypothetical protein n=1 Tax=Millisia brevis TaxID=264148 RepID=UPI000830FAEC|nr:hypothetical protein [Millisia brevis]
MTTLEAPTRRVLLQANADDLAAVRDLVTPETEIRHENPSDDLSRVVVKPWGHESRVFADPVYDLWHLCIRAGGATSMHAHLRKTTHQLCLSGEGRFDTLHGSHAVTPGTIVSIGPAAFHRTRAISAELHLIEVETPRNKFDLLRLHDSYDRSKTAYEASVTSEGESPLEPVRRRAHTHLRRTSTGARFEFTLRSGMDIFYTPRARDLFYVPVGFESFISGHPVLGCTPGTKAPVLTDQTYLAVASR